MLTIVGLAIIFVVVLLLLTEKVSPIIAMVLVPVIGAIAMGFDLKTIVDKFFLGGIGSVMQIVIMFIFAILFFSIMSDAGVFQPIIDKLILCTRGNVVAIAVGTVFVSVIAQFDGAGATTFLLVVPALLPIYQRLKMNPYLLFLLLAASAGITNMLPWAGPLARVATVLESEVETLYPPLIKVQVVGIALTALLAFLLGLREQRRIRQQYGKLSFSLDDLMGSLAKRPAHSAKFWVNTALFLITMIVLFTFKDARPAFVFMVATTIALLINYQGPQAQLDCINRYAGGALMMATIILAAGLFLGTLKHSGMLDSISADLITFLPEAIRPKLHYIVAFLGQPLELVLSTDAYYFGLFPIVNEITSQSGVAPEQAGYAVMIGSIVGTFVTPFSPALWMGLGLANLSMGKHIRYSFMWVWLLSLLLLLSAWLMGLI